MNIFKLWCRIRFWFSQLLVLHRHLIVVTLGRNAKHTCLQDFLIAANCETSDDLNSVISLDIRNRFQSRRPENKECLDKALCSTSTKFRHWVIIYPSCVIAPVAQGNMALLTFFHQGSKNISKIWIILTTPSLLR